MLDFSQQDQEILLKENRGLHLPVLVSYMQRQGYQTLGSIIAKDPTIHHSSQHSKLISTIVMKSIVSLTI